jgi:hypothetical protein
MVFDFMDTDLHVVNQLGILEDTHKQYIIYQVSLQLYLLFIDFESVEVHAQR